MSGLLAGFVLAVALAGSNLDAESVWDRLFLVNEFQVITEPAAFFGMSSTS